MTDGWQEMGCIYEEIFKNGNGAPEGGWRKTNKVWVNFTDLTLFFIALHYNLINVPHYLFTPQLTWCVATY